jgi:hypothetical protein
MHPLESIQEVISAILQWVFMLAAAISPIVLNVWAWKRLRRPPVPDTSAPWQRRVAYLSLASNLFAYALPLAALIRNVTSMNADELVNWGHMQIIIAAFVVLSLALAAIGPKYVRLQLILSPLLPFFFWICLPTGIL